MEPPKGRPKNKLNFEDIKEYFCIKDIKDCSQCIIYNKCIHIKKHQP